MASFCLKYMTYGMTLIPKYWLLIFFVQIPPPTHQSNIILRIYLFAYSLCLGPESHLLFDTSSMNLTSEKQGRSSTIQDRSRKCLTEEQEFLSRWTEYYSALYNHESCRDSAVLDCSQLLEEDLQPILREEVVTAVAWVKRGSLPELIIYLRSCSSWRGDHDCCFNGDL